MEVAVKRLDAGLRKLKLPAAIGLAAAAGIALGAVGAAGLAETAIPTEHKGLSVETLGLVPAESMSAQVGLDGHILLFRRITIAPGGQIAKHSAESTPAGARKSMGMSPPRLNAGSNSLSTRNTSRSYVPASCAGSM